jgi:hypothetical protein
MLEQVLLPAFDAGVATDADLLWALLGQRPNRPFQKVFKELGEASSMLRRGTLSQCAAVVVRRAIDRVVEIELNRGEQATEASLPALYLRNASGGQALLKLLDALPGEPVRELQEPTSANPTDVSRAGVWSWLIQSTWPTEEDTPAAFAAAVNATQIGEETLLRTAVFAPQWAEHVEAALSWPGLAEAVWWLRAHTRRGMWIINPDKKEVWQTSIQRRTAFSLEALDEGAVDADWFSRAFAGLGEGRWDRLATMAPFASPDAGYERAVRNAQILLGRAMPLPPRPAATMDDVLPKLHRYVTGHPKTAVFEPPASDAQIADAERSLTLPIPDDYKSFLRQFDGGFLIQDGTREDWVDKEHAAWNSNQLMGCAGLAWATEMLKDMYWIDLDLPWEHVGFCHTDGQQFLAFAPASHPSPGAVLRVSEGEMPEDWTAIYPTFAAFLDAFLRLEGHGDVAWPDFRAP